MASMMLDLPHPFVQGGRIDERFEAGKLDRGKTHALFRGSARPTGGAGAGEGSKKV
jgi:hypothetical protein